MMWKACVRYKGALAHYYIRLEHEGIYRAELTRYDGRVDHYPPFVITLINGGKGWTSSTSDHHLMDELRKIIENKVHHLEPGKIQNPEQSSPGASYPG